MTTNNASLQVPAPHLLDAIQKLCDISSPYDSYNQPETQALFVQAMQQNIHWHRERSPFYRKLLESKGFKSEQLRSVEDCAKVPFILANFFKNHEILSIPKEQVSLHLTSSGTTGQKSQIFFDSWSIQSAQRMVHYIFDTYGWNTPNVPTNYLLYTYETERNSKLGTAYTDNFLCQFAPVNEVFYALRLTGTGSHEFDIFGCLEALQRYAKTGLPIRIFGFPAFLYFTLKRMKDLKLPLLKFPENSLLFLGGGWKGHADQAIDKLAFYHEVHECLGIPDSQLRDGFGSVEHCIPYVECTRHQFHIPIWSRVFIRDVKTLKTLPLGEKGFLNFVSPYITSVPAQSVLMGDLASLHATQECGCGTPSPFFKIHGRAGTSKNKSCALAAAELIRRDR